MEETSLRITGANKSFINKISNTISKILIPTKIGINGMLITVKRNSMIKAIECIGQFIDKLADPVRHQFLECAAHDGTEVRQREHQLLFGAIVGREDRLRRGKLFSVLFKDRLDPDDRVENVRACVSLK